MKNLTVTEQKLINRAIAARYPITKKYQKEVRVKQDGTPGATSGESINCLLFDPKTIDTSYDLPFCEKALPYEPDADGLLKLDIGYHFSLFGQLAEFVGSIYVTYDPAQREVTQIIELLD